jgi:hypothetical protein
MEEYNDLAIVPGERIGPYRLDWDIKTLISHLPQNYSLYYDDYCWLIKFNYYFIQVRKIDSKIDYISISNDFNETFLGKKITGCTLGHLEEQFGETDIGTMDFTLPDYPGVEFYFEDEKEGDEDENAWKEVKLTEVIIRDPTFYWDEHFSKEDYDKMRKNEFPCPFL